MASRANGDETSGKDKCDEDKCNDVDCDGRSDTLGLHVKSGGGGNDKMSEVGDGVDDNGKNSMGLPCDREAHLRAALRVVPARSP